MFTEIDIIPHSCTVNSSVKSYIRRLALTLCIDSTEDKYLSNTLLDFKESPTVGGR